MANPNLWNANPQKFVRKLVLLAIFTLTLITSGTLTLKNPHLDSKTHINHRKPALTLENAH